MQTRSRLKELKDQCPVNPVLDRSLLFTLIHFSSIVKQALFAYVNRDQISSWNQPVPSNVV